MFAVQIVITPKKFEMHIRNVLVKQLIVLQSCISNKVNIFYISLAGKSNINQNYL